MSLPPALDPALTAGLASGLTQDETEDRTQDRTQDRTPGQTGAPGPQAPVPVPPLSAARVARPARRLASRALRRATTKARPRVVRFLNEQTAPLREQAGAAAARLDGLEEQLAALQQERISQELLRGDVLAIKTSVESAVINLELLKGEIRQTDAVLERLGMAIAPATGIVGAEVRMAELRERVSGLDRRLRTLSARAEAAPAPAHGEAGRPADSSAPASPAADPPAAREQARSALFDYVGFERRFRGDPVEVLAILDERYGALLAAHPPVLDVGCGRAELLAVLRERGVQALGVDTDPTMVAEAQAQGLDVHEVDAVTYLRSLEPGTLGAIIATHVVEHLQLDELIELLELAATRLRPGGVLIAETPNPSALIVLGNSYLLDPTHVRPLHPSLLAFLCEGAGFRGVELRFFSPATGYHLPLVQDPEAPAWVETVNQGFRQLNDVLFGNQDFAVVATAAPADPERKPT